MQPSTHTCPADEEYVLPTVEALLAGTLALMTGCAQEGSDQGMRSLMAGKVVSNLVRLSGHPDLSPAMRSMLSQLSERWAGAGRTPSAWVPAPGAIQ